MAYAAVRPRHYEGPWGRRIGIVLRASCALGAMALLGGLMWHAYGEGQSGGSTRAIPLVRADAGPIKTRPKEPGGLSVPHRDKRIYERLAPGSKRAGGGKVERLIPRSKVGDISPAAGGSAKRVARPKVKGGAARVRVAVERKKAKRRAAPKPAAAPGARRGRYRIQIAAYPSPQLAARRWQKLKGRHKDLVRNLEWYVEKINRAGGRAPLYRLQLGPLKDRRAAQELCAKFGKRKVSCLFVKG